MPVYKTSNSGLLTRREYTSFLAGNEQFIAWEPIGAYDSIATTTVGAGGAATITFSSIPSTYTHLQIRFIGRSVTTNGTYDSLLMRFNSDTGTNYSQHAILGNGASVFADVNNGVGYIVVDPIASSGAIANNFGAGNIDIIDYANTNKFKSIKHSSGFDNNGTGATSFQQGYKTEGSGNWRSTSAISTITLNTGSTSNFAQYSSFALYGIKGD